MNSISSKFSSSQQAAARNAGSPTATSPLPSSGSNGSVEATELLQPQPSSKQKESSFFSSLTRRLSGSQTSGVPRNQGKGGLCERRVLNIDPNRERFRMPEMDPSQLRKVFFSVDVEIAGLPKYSDDEEDDRPASRIGLKMKEKAEGEALKHPEALLAEQSAVEPPVEKALPIPGNELSNGVPDENLQPKTGVDDDGTSRKKEKKKRSEEERKERKEKRRQRAEESGCIPVEVPMDIDTDQSASTPPSDEMPSLPTDGAGSIAQATPKQAGPTKNPARIYRRCCQLRETPILKRITEQLMNPKRLHQEPGVVELLDLTGSRLQPTDFVTLGDWLAVVPVKHLRLEDADMNDEGVRCVLSGLLATKVLGPPGTRSKTPRHREGIPWRPMQERAGMVEKITFKNNPRITRQGWKHMMLFIYLCRSVKTMDVSMNQFPSTLPPSAQATPTKPPQKVPPSTDSDLDAAEALYKCLSERLEGSRLEELIMSECGLSATQVERVVEGCIASGVSRIGLAGNNLDDECLRHVIRYLQSGVCQAIDLGSNDLRGKLGMLAEAIVAGDGQQAQFWGISLADCNLDSESLQGLFATLITLADFRFIDLSHNRDLCGTDNGLISLLRRYIGRLQGLKRMHLLDVGMSPKQAIALADVLPEGPRLAHVNLLENPQLTALANATTEEDQEEACALYASLMAAVRVSSTIICLDMDVSVHTW